MDYQLQQQWRKNNEEPDLLPPCSKAPRLQLEQHPHMSALALFETESKNNKPTSTTTTTTASLSDPMHASRFTRSGGCFSLGQWEELEVQALIFKYMISGASVPLELIESIKKSLLSGHSYYHHHHYYPHLQPALFQTGYWGRGMVDPEPGRCRRTDGKKWRCSREVVPGQKYCERHVHRGRNRSRKPVETSAPPPPPPPPTKATQFNIAGPSPTLSVLPLNQRQPDGICNEEFKDNASDGRILRPFFDDWPRSHHEQPINTTNPTTCLSISIPDHPPSDFSLKLSMGGDNTHQHCYGTNRAGNERRPPSGLTNWMSWGSHGEATSLGGPLAEALRSPASATTSPTSVLRVPGGSGLERSSISA
ncbi:Growth-regulating factor 3 [Acorus calamus]|uniref:Growth-regulating factor n=1 Tax=Acorus calamus TaxID=4465 RepID=A0AAV9DIA4_ACOCL|nr:Growth-regulating factor 3 [Acorus calamus]